MHAYTLYVCSYKNYTYHLTPSSMCQVTLTGSWKFFSTLPFPLHLSLVTTRDTETTNNEEDNNFSLETFLLTPKSSLPSLVVPGGCLSGVRVKSPHSAMWSDVYPIHSATDDWSKPQLLTEVHAQGYNFAQWLIN